MASAAIKRPLRILFIAPYVPSLVRVRPYNLIKSLAARGHRVTLCVPTTSAREGDHLADVASYCERIESVPLSRLQPLWSCTRAVFRGLPMQAMYCYAPELQRRIDRWLVGDGGAPAPDVVHVEHLRAALFGWSHVEVPHVFDAVDCISQLFARTTQASSARLSRMLARLDLPRTRRFERRLVERFARVVTTSESERRALLDLCVERNAAPAGGARSRTGTGPRIDVVTNGVDLDYFRPQRRAQAPPTLVYVGRMSYHANVTAAVFLARDIMPRVWARHPGVRLTVVGERPHPRVRKLAEQHPSRISVTGGVPDVRPYLAEATVSVAPVLYGVGVQNKVLEAMAMGTPVVCSPASCNALAVRDGEHVLVAQSAEEFAAAVARLINETALQQRLSQAARTYVEQHHDWRRSAAQLEDIYHEEIAKRAINNER